MKPFYLCKTYLLSHKYALSTYIATILAATVISILSPYIIGNFLDNLIPGADTRVILRFSLIFGGLSLIKIVKDYVAGIMRAKMHVKMSYNFNKDAIHHDYYSYCPICNSFAHELVCCSINAGVYRRIFRFILRLQEKAL